MDYKFPQQLFPAFFNTGPPATVYKHNAGNWGSYEGVRPGHPDGGSGRLSRWTFTSRHQIRAETWLPVEPVPLPLRSPKQVFLWPSTPPDPQDFTQHMENFFMDHHLDAFGCMAEVLEENFCFKQERKQRCKKDAVHMWRVKRCIDALQYKKCEFSHVSQTSDSYSDLLSDVVHAVPPALLGALLHEELAGQRDRALFDESATGGALAFVPFTQSGGGASQPGCLLYPAGRASNLLNFHRVVLQQPSGGPPCLDASSSKPFIFQVKGPVRQISTAAPLSDCCVAVRSNHMCGFWTLRETDEPRLRQAVHTEQPATCVSVSPHVPGEVLLTSESGAANLWTVGKGTQVIREEDSNLYFNARSKWRWCEFSAHPRVMVYADRTGVELTDMRARSGSSHTLFRVSSTSECKSGERVVLSRYLADAHAFHHLVTTQYSAYIMDERFPCMPMLKWDHMMESPPMFCHVLPGPASSSSSVVGGANSTKILLGSQRSQEITLLQCADGRAEACVRRGPPQALPRPRDSLKLLPVQIPHRLVTARSRLNAPAAGLTCVQKTGRGGEDCICVLQLTQAGDIFYQILQPQQPEPGRPTPIQEEEPSPLQHGADENPSGRTKGSSASRGERAPVTSELTDARQRSLISETSSDEDVIGPTQAAAAQQFVAETPERERQPSGEMTSDSSSDESEGKGKRRRLKRLGLDVVVNDEPELDQMGDLDTEEVDNNNDGDDDGDDGDDGGNPGNAEQPGPNQRLEGNIKDTGSSRRIDASDRRPAKLSDDALIVWKRWLQKLMQRSRGNKPRPRRLQHHTVDTSRLLGRSDSERRDPNEEERLRSLRRDLRQCMTRGSLLVHAATGLQPLETVPVPNPVDTEAWPDDLSRRLTVSWRGDECWKAWWEDSLGLNREAKVEALRRKRRRQKEARRASQRLELSGSFTSTVSYQTELDSFSDSAGWSSAASQRTWSDNDDFLSQLDVWSEPGTPRATASRAATPTDATPSSLPPATPQKRQHQQQHLQAAPSGSAPPDSSPAATSSERKAKRRAENLLSSLFGSEDSSQSFYLEEVSAVDLGPLPAASRLLGSQSSFSQRSVRVDLSQSALPQSLPPSQSLLSRPGTSQSSLGRPGASQSSQPKKKKSRIGF